MPGLEYAEDIVPLSEDPGKLQVFADHLNNSVGMFDLGFASLNSKMPFQNWIGLTMNIVLEGEGLSKVDRMR